MNSQTVTPNNWTEIRPEMIHKNKMIAKPVFFHLHNMLQKLSKVKNATFFIDSFCLVFNNFWNYEIMKFSPV